MGALKLCEVGGMMMMMMMPLLQMRKLSNKNVKWFAQGQTLSS